MCEQVPRTTAIPDADGTPLSEVGVIATQAKILAEADISIFYLSTYENDYTLVSQADIARAAEAFESAGFRLEQSCSNTRSRSAARSQTTPGRVKT